MAQYKKDEVKERIDSAALSVFAEKGYRSAKVSDISAAAGVSVGNIYRYYANKDDIFYSLIPEDFPAEFKAVIARKIGSAQTGRDSRAIADMADVFIGFMAGHREQITILFSGSQGTRYASIKSDFADILLSLVRELYPEKYAAYIARYGDDRALALVYENLIGMYGYLLRSTQGEEELIHQMRQVNLYHFSGIMRLLDV
jgi:AcrR family transcriptional regulator